MSSIKELEDLLSKLPARGGELVPVASDLGANIALKDELSFARQGGVQGAWERWDRQRLAPDTVFFLPPGERHAVPPRTALSVLSSMKDQEVEWSRFEMPAGGDIIGPMVWGWNSPDSEGNLVRSALRHTHSTKGSIIGGGVSLSTFFSIAGAGLALWLTGTTGILAFLLVSVLGLIPAVLMALILPRVFAKRLSATERRSALELNLKMPDHFVALPGRAAKMLESVPVSEREPVAPQGDKDLLQAIRDYRAAKDELAAWEGGDRGDKAMIRHTSAMLEEIAGRLISAKSLSDGGDLRQSFLDLLSRAEGDVRRVLGAQRAQEQSSVMGDIDALNAQLDRHFGAKGG
jgi:hypothetical protein